MNKKIKIYVNNGLSGVHLALSATYICQLQWSAPFIYYIMIVEMSPYFVEFQVALLFVVFRSRDMFRQRFAWIFVDPLIHVHLPLGKH